MKQFKSIAMIALVAVLAFGALTPAVSARAHNDRQTGKPDLEAIRAQREERKAEIKQRVEVRKAEIKQRVCERKQKNINRVIPRLSERSTRLVGVIDKIYERVDGFYHEGPLTVENYDELAADVDAAQAEAHAAVEAIADFEFELDCEDPDVSEQLDSFREAVTLARPEIKAYRDALVTLISSLRAEAAIENSENNSDSEDEKENETEETETNEEQEVENE